MRKCIRLYSFILQNKMQCQTWPFISLRQYIYSGYRLRTQTPGPESFGSYLSSTTDLLCDSRQVSWSLCTSLSSLQWGNKCLARKVVVRIKINIHQVLTTVLSVWSCSSWMKRVLPNRYLLQFLPEERSTIWKHTQAHRSLLCFQDQNPTAPQALTTASGPQK